MPQYRNQVGHDFHYMTLLSRILIMRWREIKMARCNRDWLLLHLKLMLLDWDSIG